MNEKFDITAARRNLSLATESRRAELLELHAAACRDFASIVEMIKSKYRPKRIWQWGSLLDAKSFREYSDIDLGIEGINDPVTIFTLLGDAERLTALPLDIVQLEKIEPEFADIIRSKGKLIYERA